MNNRLARDVGRVLRLLRNLRFVDQRKVHRLWEQHHLSRVLAHFAVDCVFDVGANYGQYATMLRRQAGYRGLIVSFEPIPEAAHALRRASAGDPLWVIEEVAASSRDGEQTFHRMNDSEFSSLSAPRSDETPYFGFKNAVQRSITVRTETLGSAYHRLKTQHGFERPFLKLDTQGYDVEIVSHARDIIPEFIGLQSELAVTRLYESSVDFREAVTLYERCGLQLSAFVPNNSGHFPMLVELDCIMIRADLMQVGRSMGSAC